MKRKALLLAVAAAALSSCQTLGKPGPDAGDPWASNPEAADGAIRAVPMPSAPLDVSKTVSRIIFASCAQQNADQSIWDQIAAENPDLTLYIGDNVYGDVRSNDRSLPELKAAYMRLAQSEPFARVRRTAPVLTTWDDHDMGMNDAGGEYQYKEQSEALYEYVWDVHDARADRPGVYGAWILGEEDGKRVQVIMLDTRYFRSPLKETDERNARGKERYVPDPDPAKTMLGAAQWDWLKGELEKPADLRLLVSSVQVFSDGHGWEAWKMLPAEREKLYRMIEDTGARGVVMLSGDRHAAGFYQRDDVISYPLFEATSSSLNLPVSGFKAPGAEPYMEPGPHRIGDMYEDANYGLIEIDWSAGAVAISIRTPEGASVMTEEIAISSLQ